MFKNINFKSLRDEIGFLNCHFINCTFRIGSLKLLSFNNSFFENVKISNTKGNLLSISNCRLKNSSLFNTSFDHIQIWNSLCWKFNIECNRKIKWLDIYKIIAFNMSIVGNEDIEELKIRIFKEIDKTEFNDNEYNSFFCTGSWHLKRILEDRAYIHSYRSEHRIKAWFWKWFGGNYGESVIWFSIWPILIFAVFSCIYYLNPQFFFSYNGWDNWFQPIYFSIVTFSSLGFGDIHPITGWGQFYVVIEVIFGYIFLGGIVSLFANKMLRKS